MRLLARKVEEVPWEDELCCEEKDSRRPGRQVLEGRREAGKGIFSKRVNWKGGTAPSRQAGCLGRRCSNQTVSSPSIPLLTTVRIRPGALCTLGKYFTTELGSEPNPFVNEAAVV